MTLTFSHHFQHQPWLKLRPLPHSIVAAPWRQWLLDKGSLTQRLKALDGQFSVDVISTRYGRPHLSEARLLGIHPRMQVYIREVALCINNQPVVKARSIIPRSTLTGLERQLLWLKDKPLGEFLFQHRNMRRGPIEVKLGKLQGEQVWGRRSCFYLNQKPVLVGEWFLPALIDYS